MLRFDTLRNFPAKVFHLTLCVSLAVGIMSCRNGSSEDGVFSTIPVAATAPHMQTDHRDFQVVPPAGYYDQQLANQFFSLDSDSAFAESEVDQVLYLDFDGATVEQGFGTGESFIPCQSESTIQDSGFSDAQIDDMIERVQGYYDHAEALVEVTDIVPDGNDHTTIIIGGSYGDLGCGEFPGVLGVAPLDEDNTNPSDIGFAFTKYEDDVSITAVTIAHEAGHSFGLYHIDNNIAIMYPAVAPGISNFDEGYIVGSQSRNGQFQHSPKTLREALGKNDDPKSKLPDPLDEDEDEDDDSSPAPAPTNEDSDDRSSIEKVPILGDLIRIFKDIFGASNWTPVGEIESWFSLTAQSSEQNKYMSSLLSIRQLMVAAAANEGYCDSACDLAEFASSLSSSSGEELAAMAGFSSIELALSAHKIDFDIHRLKATDITHAQLGPYASVYEDFSSLLDLNHLKSFKTLKESHFQAAKLVHANFDGANRAVMLSLLKVAYTQAYMQNIRGK